MLSVSTGDVMTEWFDSLLSTDWGLDFRDITNSSLIGNQFGVW
ncbi:hypothetical protein [Acetobacter cibinongensis]|nr:hypothetical protein [Acetobacter cibinongensis]